MFGPRLKEERERRGISLDAIVASTKIKRSLLEALERNDLSRWPHGLFGRSYIRDYVGALGLPSEPMVAEFMRLLPEANGQDANGTPVPRDPAPAIPHVSPLRLTLAFEEDRRPTKSAWLVAAAADASAVVAGGALMALVSGAGIWTAVGVFALAYSAVSTAWKGRSFAAWWLSLDATTRRVRGGFSRRAESHSLDPAVPSPRGDGDQRSIGVKPSVHRTGTLSGLKHTLSSQAWYSSVPASKRVPFSKAR